MPATNRQTYEQYAVSTAIELVREIVTMLEASPVSSQWQEKLKQLNANRAHRAIDNLTRISQSMEEETA